MSLMDNHPRPSSRQKHRSSLPPPLATVPFFQDQLPPSSPRRHQHHHHHHHYQGRRHSKHRLSNASMSSSSSSSLLSPSMLTSRSFNNTFELVFTHLIDALIFTSAIAITAYNYWMGYISDPPRIYGSPIITTPTSAIPSSPPPKPYCPSDLLKPLDIPSPPLSVLSSPSSPTTKSDPTWSDLKRTPEQQSVSSSNRLHSQENDVGPSLQLLSPPPPEQEVDDDDDDNEPQEEEERVNRMEETLQELIRQGQAALTSPIDWK